MYLLDPHIVPLQLLQVNMRQPLTRYRLQKILNVREHDMLESDPPATLQALEEYAEGTASQLLQLQVVHLASMQMHMYAQHTGSTANHF